MLKATPSIKMQIWTHMPTKCKSEHKGDRFKLMRKRRKSYFYVVSVSCCFRLDIIIGHDIGCVSAAYVSARLEVSPAFVVISPLITIPTK